MVLDSSVAIAWCIKAEQTAELLKLFEELQTQDLHVPAIWPIEVANILTNAKRKNRISEAEFDDAVLILQSLRIRMGQPRKISEIPTLAILVNTHALTAYDAEYLALALQINEGIATLDKQLRSAATSVGLSVSH